MYTMRLVVQEKHFRLCFIDKHQSEIFPTECRSVTLKSVNIFKYQKTRFVNLKKKNFSELYAFTYLLSVHLTARVSLS